MSGLVTTGEKNLVLVSGRAHMDLAHAVGEEIGCGVSPVTAYDFASGEIYVALQRVRSRRRRVRPAVHRGRHQQVAHGAAHHD